MAEAFFFLPCLAPVCEGGKWEKKKENERKERKMGKNGGALRKISFSLANGTSWWCARGLLLS